MTIAHVYVCVCVLCIHEAREVDQLHLRAANRHPDCHVTGADLQAFETWKILESSRLDDEGSLPNLSFTTMNSGEPWHFEEKFDFIHTQSLSNCASTFLLFFI